jgi:hypothetical protein
MSNKHIGGYCRPSVCAATPLKKFLAFPLKATIFEKFTLTIQIEI